MKIKYQSINVTPPPLDVKIVVKKSQFAFSDGAKIRVMDSIIWSEDSAAEWLIGSGFDLWAEV